MVEEKSFSTRLFTFINYVFLGALALLCVLPMLHLVAVSFSESAFVQGGRVGFIPQGFNLYNYQETLRNSNFIRAFVTSILRVVVGTGISMFFIIITAYPLAREAHELRGRNAFMWFLVIPMLFSGGLIPTFLLIRELGLLNTFWVMVLPSAVPVFSVIVMMNFLRGLPPSLYEAALVDGAGHFTILFRIFVPLSMAPIATLALFSMVFHWNSWFDALIYISDMRRWPLQTLLQSAIMQGTQSISDIRFTDLERLRYISNRGLVAAQIIITTIPILCVYPFLQKHFVKGIVLGSTKE
jgi:putative aldouronate transport system permease protein